MVGRWPREPVRGGLAPGHRRVLRRLLFFLAVSITHNGVWGQRQNRMLVPYDDWLRRSIKETARAYGLAILCAWLLATSDRTRRPSRLPNV